MQQNKLSLSQYIVYRNGVPAGARGSMRNMLHRSFGAPTLAGFWRHWNPIFSYGLGRYIYSPLKRFMPSALAVVATFVFCGALHDLVTVAVRGAPAFLFTPWFFLLGTGVVLAQAWNLDLSERPRIIRAVIHLAYISACLAATLTIKHIVA